MLDPDVPQDDPELVAILGANLVAQLAPDARSMVKWEATKYPGGVARVANAVRNDPSIRNAAAVLLDRLKREQHHDTTSPPMPARSVTRNPGPQPCPTCGKPPYGYRPVHDGCRTCGRPHTTRAKQERTP